MPGTDTATLLLALPADPQPPVQYSWWVWALGLALLALIAAWYWWVFWSTRPQAIENRRGKGDPFAELRAEHLAEIDTAYARYTAGEADLRTLHLDYNHLVRRFATARAGIDVTSLTVGELGRLEHGSALQTLLEDYQEPAFAAGSDAQALAATEQAKEVIRTW